MQNTTGCSLTIAGFDPSGGAGILADIKTFEQLNVRALAATTAITLQTEDTFKGVAWIPLHQIELQIETLLQKYPVEYAKIGLIQNLEILNALLFFIEKNFPHIRVIWDPVVKSSSGFTFHGNFEEALLNNILSKIYLITPNVWEAGQLMQSDDAWQSAKELSRFCNVFLKSFNGNTGPTDVLFENRKEYFLATDPLEGHEKHGSGCVLTAAITGLLASGSGLFAACNMAKDYTRQFLMSDGGLMGWHHGIKIVKHV